MKHKAGMISSIIFFIAIISVLTFLPISFTGITNTIYPELYAWNIIPKPETFTELYFQNHESLPFEILPNQKYSFVFTLHNEENRNMIYPYSVYVLTDNRKITLQQKSIALRENQVKNISINFSTSAALPKSKIIVDLPDKKQSIDFWINE